MTTAQAESARRTREYLARLTPLARSSLLTEIERLQMYGEDVSAFAPILAALRAEFRQSGESASRVGNPSRYFFKPIETLFVDRAPERANAGQISRGSLAPIWEWINHELLPTMARDYCEAMKTALVGGHVQEASRIADAFQSKVIKSLQGKLASTEGEKSAEQGLAQYTSSRACISDLKKTLAALQIREAIVALEGALPAKIDRLEGEALAKVQALLDAFVAKHPAEAPFALTVIMKRLKHPWQLVQFAIRSAYSSAASDVATSRYAIAVSMVLDHLDDRRWLLRQALKSNRVETAKEILVDIYDVEYQLHDWIARLDQSDWGRRLDECMAALAADLDAEYHTIPGDIHDAHLHHVLEGVERRRPGAGLLHHLWLKGRDVLASVPIPKFAAASEPHLELRNRKDAS
ncbi:MAG TPA: hypothetical protein VFL62_18700 [Bradyrhizobium sp.]|uniref:hypothetical protein n=1 Tax=Bradyrhizobium sp. TaxID=376 RepID=UPI002D8111EF|nr:hypothetical protein [Bradyrhizobium sp.]HET7888257.1 hypothetical protein [Bradyrhizobium sp.]